MMTPAQLLAATAAVALLLLALYRVYQRRPLRAALGLTAAGLLTLYAVEVLTALPDPQAALERSGEALGSWAYPLVAGMAFFETGAPPFTVIFPGEWGVVYGGLLARDGELVLPLLILAIWAASLLGDSWSFFLGRRFGRGYLVRHGARLGVTHHRLARLDAFFARWGAATVALGRMVPFARPFVPLLAGASAWPYRRFLPWSLLGTGVFALTFTLLGYLAYAAAKRLVETSGDAALIAVPAAALLAFVVLLLRRAAARRGSCARTSDV